MFLRIRLRSIATKGMKIIGIILSIHTSSISGRVDRATATETIDLDSIFGRVKPNSIKVDFHSFLA